MKKNALYIYALIVLSCLLPLSAAAQGAKEYSGGYKIKFNENGSKYMRIISWGQFWTTFKDAEGNNSNVDFKVRRARILAFTQLNKKFLILTHFGLNNLDGSNLSTSGKGESAQLFFHDFWGEYKMVSNHYVGMGLHYWNGISRLNNQSTLNMMTLDNNRQSWATLGLSDQFARHLGVYFKGNFGKLQYRASINRALKNNLQAGADSASIANITTKGPRSPDTTVYAGTRLLGSKEAGFTYAAYLEYNFFDQESMLLPYKVGTYLGSKKVLNVGVGFSAHPYGSVVFDANGNRTDEVNAVIFSIDAFYDAPLGGNNDAITAYLAYQNNDYGPDYEYKQTYATGNMIYGHVGYLLPGEKEKIRFQPYVSGQFRTIEKGDTNATRFAVGNNFYFTGHHSKVTVEYSNDAYGDKDAVGALTVQAMIYL